MKTLLIVISLFVSTLSVAKSESYLSCRIEADSFGNEDAVHLSAQIVNKSTLKDVRLVYVDEVLVFADSVKANLKYKPENPKYKGYVQFKMTAVDDIPCSPVLVVSPDFTKKSASGFRDVDASIRLTCTDNQGIYNGLCVVRGYR